MPSDQLPVVSEMRWIATRLVSALLLTILLAAALNAETCEIRPDLSVPQACGQVTQMDGKPIENVELNLVKDDDEAVASTKSNFAGEFKFDVVEKGDYHIIVVKSDRWAGVRWKVRVTKGYRSSDNQVCHRRIYVLLSSRVQTVCNSYMTTKHPKYEDAQTN